MGGNLLSASHYARCGPWSRSTLQGRQMSNHGRERAHILRRTRPREHLHYGHEGHRSSQTDTRRSLSWTVPRQRATTASHGPCRQLFHSHHRPDYMASTPRPPQCRCCIHDTYQTDGHRVGDYAGHHPRDTLQTVPKGQANPCGDPQDHWNPSRRRSRSHLL